MGIIMIIGYLGVGKIMVSGINYRLVCKLSEDLMFLFLFFFNEIFFCKLNCWYVGLFECICFVVS